MKGDRPARKPLVIITSFSRRESATGGHEKRGGVVAEQEKWEKYKEGFRFVQVKFESRFGHPSGKQELPWAPNCFVFIV